MRILVATDAWHPQVNGVVRTYGALAQAVQSLGHELVFLTPDDYAALPFSAYPGLRIAIWDMGRTRRLMEAAAVDFVHIATEGPVGLMARKFCRERSRPFTTAYHTRFPEYAATMLAVPSRLTHAGLRWFHDAAAGTMVATHSMRAELKQRGFRRLLPWTRGVDCNLFRPQPIRLFGPGPVLLSVGRLSREKNLDAFLALDVPGHKVVVGDGPDRTRLQRLYRDAQFVGPRFGEDLARHYASADVFVFPSRTDTFGLVMIEAMACGVPVASYPVTGPMDVVENGISGVLGEDLAGAIRRAMELDRAAVRARALTYSWETAAEQFMSNIAWARETAPGARSVVRSCVPATTTPANQLRSREKPFG